MFLIFLVKTKIIIFSDVKVREERNLNTDGDSNFCLFLAWFVFQNNDYYKPYHLVFYKNTQNFRKPLKKTLLFKILIKTKLIAKTEFLV